MSQTLAIGIAVDSQSYQGFILSFIMSYVFQQTACCFNKNIRLWLDLSYKVHHLIIVVSLLSGIEVYLKTLSVMELHFYHL